MKKLFILIVLALFSIQMVAPVEAATRRPNHQLAYDIKKNRAKQVLTPAQKAAKTCSLKANSLKLHGTKRAKFRAKCKAAALKK